MAVVADRRRHLRHLYPAPASRHAGDLSAWPASGWRNISSDGCGLNLPWTPADSHQAQPGNSFMAIPFRACVGVCGGRVAACHTFTLRLVVVMLVSEQPS